MSITVAALVVISLLALVVAALRLHKAIDRANRRFRGLATGHREAGQLVASRERFRQRQQRVERALDTGTLGVRAAHRTLSGWFGGRRDSGAAFYERVRAFNHGAGRAVSSVLAPTPKKHEGSPGER